MGQVLAAKILFLGLDGSGKTSLLTYLKSGPNDIVPKPTVGFEVKEVKYKGVDMSIYDVAGSAKVRDLWRHYYAEADAIVWVVDCADQGRLAESRQALATALKDAAMKTDTPFLVAANKSDLAGAKSDEEVRKALDLDSLLKGRSWVIKRINSKSGDGIPDSFKWLSSELKAYFKKHKK
jgi:small GTP-binding protein